MAAINPGADRNRILSSPLKYQSDILLGRLSYLSQQKDSGVMFRLSR